MASAGGWWLNSLLKEFFSAPAAEVVPHLSEVMSLSFPSGHAMTSAAVYLHAWRAADAYRRPAGDKDHVMRHDPAGLAGDASIYDYPTDVLAGWYVVALSA